MTKCGWEAIINPFGGGIVELTRSEMEIMDVLWKAGVPLSRAELIEKSTEKSWKDSSVHILLNGLLQKRAIREVGFVKCSKTYGRTFAPVLSREQYFVTALYQHKYKPDAAALFEAILSREEITKEEIEQVKKLLENR